MALKICSNCGRKYLTSEDFFRNTSRWRLCETGHLWFNCACKSTCMIPRGTHNWFDTAQQTQQMSPQAQRVFQQIPSLHSLPRLPSSVMEIQNLLDDPNADAAQLARVLKRDPLLAAQVFKIVHQRVTEQKVQSLAHAISMLGIESIKELVLIAGLGTLKLQTRYFDSMKFWEQSFFVGSCAEYLAKRLQLRLDPDLAYISGSVCNIGKIVFAACIPELADTFVQDIENPLRPCSWTQAEERHLGYHHTVLGEIGALMWGLPHIVINVIAYHHKLAGRSPLEPIRTYEIIGFANQLSHRICQQEHLLDKELYFSLCSRFSIDAQQVEELVTDMRNHLHLPS